MRPASPYQTTRKIATLLLEQLPEHQRTEAAVVAIFATARAAVEVVLGTLLDETTYGRLVADFRTPR